LPDLSVALRLYRGAFLAGCHLPDCPDFADWLQFQRDRLEKKYTQALRAQVTFALSQGDYQAAVAYGRRILEIDNLDEGVVSDLMLAYYRLGARDTALDVYDSFRHMLLQRLELEPLAETRNLYLQIRNGTFAEARTYSLASARTAATATATSLFVGRQAEQARLARAMDLALGGRGSVVVITGEGGVGKTRLVNEFLRSVARRPISILAACCYAQEQGLLYQPIIDALRAYLPAADWEYLQGLDGLWLAEVAKLLPELHSHLPQRLSRPNLLPEQERNRLFEGLAQFIAHLSRRRAVVVFLDDLHAADEATLSLIHYLSRRLATARVLLLSALRSEGLVDRPVLARLLADLERGECLTRVPLGRLIEAEVVDLVRRVLGAPGPAGTTDRIDEIGHRLYAETAGNPFFLVELLKARQEWRGGAPAEWDVPSTVRDVIGRRLSWLDEDSRRLLELASAIGRQFTSDLLRQLGRGSDLALMAALDQLLRRGWILEVAGAPPGTYDFNHTLVREVVYQSQRADWRMSTHRQIGEVLERAADRNEIASLLVHHFERAGDDARTLDYSLLAAAHARRLYAYAEAVDHYQRVADLVRRGRANLSKADWLDIQCQWGETCEFLGRYDEAIAIYTDALSQRDASNPAHRRMGFQHALALDHKGEYEQALDILQSISAPLADPRDLAARSEAAMIARGIALVHLHREQSHQALAYCQQALALLGSDLDQTVRDSAASGISERVATYGIMASSYFHLGHYDSAIGFYQMALDIALTADHRAAMSQMLLGLGEVARRQGYYERARAYATQSLEICHDIGHVAGVAASLGTLGTINYHRGDWEQAASYFNQALSIFRQLGDLHGVADYCISLGYLYIEADRIGEAEEYFSEALRIGQGLNSALVLIRVEYHLAKIARARKDLNQAQARAERTIDAASKAGTRVMEAISHRLLGEILTELRRPSQAEVHLIESLRLFEGLGDRFEVAWTMRSYGRLLANRGDMGHAQAHLTRSAEIFEQLSAEREAECTHQELARLIAPPDETAFETPVC
jgi:tetratricopeptide (TPR) repeat protein